MKHNNTIDSVEIEKFRKLADDWWNPEGPLKTLHDINPLRLDFIRDYLCIEGLQVLDVGCGGGILSEAMAERGANVTGIDAEASAIETAKKHVALSTKEISYFCTPVETFEFSLFDVVTSMEMLEHVQHPSEVIHHCARLLKPGGYLFLSTINRTCEAYLKAILAAEYVLKLLPKQTHDYAKFIKPSELALMVRQAGLEVIGLKGVNYNPFNRTAELANSVSVNYLMACRKAEG